MIVLPIFTKFKLAQFLRNPISKFMEIRQTVWFLVRLQMARCT